MERFISDLRSAVAFQLRLEVRQAPTHTYLPDDVTHLPVVVVGRPSLRETDTSTVMRQELDVTVLGRRINDDDAQAELDAVADETLDALGGTSGVKLSGGSLDGRLLALISERPGVVLVAGSDYPAYLFTVALDVSSC